MKINLSCFFISFIGPSGSGKSTFLNLIGCLDKPTQGKVFINNIDVGLFSRTEGTAFRRDNIGFVFNNYNLISALTVFENVEYPLLILRTDATPQCAKFTNEIPHMGTAISIRKYCTHGPFALYRHEVHPHINRPRQHF
ncbi:MAG: ATP-binding cassette domain-containing protein [Bacteroidota bacterium]|nr:ATP-binding cassette domain-containing protein [Bacteroidota bacterium]